MTTHPQTTHPQTDSAQPMLTSTVLTVVMRVAGPVQTSVHAHAIGHPERQVNVRIGDALVHLTDPAAAAIIRQRWDSGLGAALRLRERVSQTWLAPRPGTYPAAISVQLTRGVRVRTQFVPAGSAPRRPAHVEARIDQLVWQVCDLFAWRTIGNAWLAAEEHLRD